MFNYGKRIKELRTQKNISAYKLAKDLNVSQPTISRIETGSALLSVQLLESICKYFSIPLTEFFCDETQINNDNLIDEDYENLSIDELVQIYINLYPQNSTAVITQKKLLEEHSEIEELYSTSLELLEDHKKNYEIQKNLFKSMLISQMHKNKK